MDSDVIDLSCFPAESGDTDAGMSASEVGFFSALWLYVHVVTCMCAFAFEHLLLRARARKCLYLKGFHWLTRLSFGIVLRSVVALSTVFRILQLSSSKAALDYS